MTGTRISRFKNVDIGLNDMCRISWRYSAGMNIKEMDKINEEIRKFINYEVENKYKLDEKDSLDEYKNGTKSNTFERLLETLKDLKLLIKSDQRSNNGNIYNTRKNDDHKESKDFEYSSINTNLINLIKSIVEERKGKEEEIIDKCNKIKELEQNMDIMKNDDIKKMDSYKHNNLAMNELKRIIKDQKEAIKDIKGKYINQKNETESLKVINNEIGLVKENLDLKCKELLDQIKVFNDFLKGKDEDLIKFKNTNYKLEEDNKSLQSQINKIMKDRNKLETKINDQDKTIIILNEELSNEINRKYKENAEYYKEMYTKILKQNEYLNDQLNNLITVENIDMVMKSNKQKIINEDEENIFTDLDFKDNKNNNNIEEQLKTKKYEKKKKSELNEENSKEKNLEFQSMQDENQDLNAINKIFKNLKIDSNKKTNNKKHKNKILEFAKKLNEFEKEKINIRNDVKNKEDKIRELADEIMLLRKDALKTNEEKRKISDNLLQKLEILMDDNRKYQKMIFELKKNSSYNEKLPANKINFKYPETYNANNDLYNMEYQKDYDYLEKQRDKNHFLKNKNVVNDENSFITILKDIEEKMEETKYETAIDYKNYEKNLEEISQTKNAINQNNFKYNLFYDNTEENKKNPVDILKTNIDNENNPEDNKKTKEFFEFQHINKIVKPKINGKGTINKKKKNEEEEKIFFNLKKNDEYINNNIYMNAQVEANRNLKENLIKKEQSEFYKQPEKKFNLEDNAHKKETEDSTTSSLKQMIKKTEDLKDKFGDLENQLNLIKDGNGNLQEKNHEKVKAFSKYYFSDIIDIENDSDIL